MQLGKRGWEGFKFLFTNPLTFLVYLPVTLLGLLSVYISFDTFANSLVAILYMLVMLVVTSMVFTYVILKTAYFSSKRQVTFKQSIDLSMKKFLPLLLSEFILIVGVVLVSTLINFLAIIWTSNTGIAVSIVLSVLFIALLIKFFLFAPSCVLKGDLGFMESWKIVGLWEFLEIGLLLIVYGLISYGLSFLPYVGYLIDSLVFGPLIMIILTLLYLDYLK